MFQPKQKNTTYCLKLYYYAENFLTFFKMKYNKNKLVFVLKFYWGHFLLFKHFDIKLSFFTQN